MPMKKDKISPLYDSPTFRLRRDSNLRHKRQLFQCTSTVHYINVNFTAFKVNICIDFYAILLQGNDCNPKQSADISLHFHCSLTAKVCSVIIDLENQILQYLRGHDYML